MLHIVLISLSLVAGEPEFAPRLETLAFHLERLNAITVPAEFSAEKAAKLDELTRQLAAGAQDQEQFDALYKAMDGVRMWLWEHAEEKPSLPPGGMEETDAAWVVRTPQLELSLAKADLSMVVVAAQQQWRFVPCDDQDVEGTGAQFGLRSAKRRTVTPFNTGYSVGLTMVLADFPDAPGLELHLTLNLIGQEMVCELAARESSPTLAAVNWPKSIELGNRESDLSVIPRMQGMLVPGNWSQAIEARDLCNSRAFYMPWWGQIHDEQGVQVILETSDDAGGTYTHAPGGPTRITPRWYASLGRLGYLRTIRYIFSEHATYVTMCKRYREYVQQRGGLVTLREKLVRTPALAEVIGRPVVHLGALYHFVPQASLFNSRRIEANHALQTFDQLADELRALKANGIQDAYVHLDGWGFYGYDNGHPDVMPVGQEQGGWDGLRRFADTCQELGYLFAVHDQYRDFYLNAVSFDDCLALTRVDGGREQHSVWCGGPQTILNPRFAPEYVRRNHDLFAEHGINVRGAYLDVFSVVPLEESALAAHPVTRSECARYRRECFDILRARGYVVSSEEPTDFLVGSLDLVHHGPYSTSPNIGGGDATGIPVPLFNLVYHDCLLEPWDMGEDGGWGIPNGDAGRLHCLLNAGLPYAGPGSDAQQIARVHEAAALAARCGLLEMTNHEFLDGPRKQRSTFSDGTTVTVDFRTKTHEIISTGTP
ncbi:MAG: DUF5696 domain-containing protein [Pirellulaceae bacterium]